MMPIEKLLNFNFTEVFATLPCKIIRAIRAPTIRTITIIIVKVLKYTCMILNTLKRI
jgi:hypothetical protein